MYTSRLKDGRKKEKDATTNLFTRLLYYQQYTYIKKYRLFTITESKSKQT